MESSQKARILVVDDELDITIVIKRGLEGAGFLVDTFNDPAQALSHFDPDYYDMVILDIRMPKMNGFELYRELAKKDSKIKACFMTAFEIYYEEFKKVFPSYDIKRFIRKPFKIKDLQEVIRDELGKQQQ